MKKRIFSLFCILAVVLVFALTAQNAPLVLDVLAEETVSTSKKSAQEEPYVEPSTSATSATQPPMPTSSSTTKEEPSSKQDDTTKTTDPTSKPTEKPTEKPTDKPMTTEKENPATTEPGSEKDTTKTPSNTTTTKKNGKTTTTKKFVYTTTKAATPHMTIPQVDNTTVEGTTLSPLDAYFERISGDSNTFATVIEQESQTEQAENGEKKQLSTIAIVAICLGGIALVTVALTAGFAIRNKHSDGAEDIAEDYEQNAYGSASSYELTNNEPAQPARPQVDESESFTVVSLDDKDYTE